MMLTQNEFAVHNATSGTDALVLLRNQPIDIMLIDYNMPGMNGVELIRETLKTHPNLIIFVVTAYPTAYLGRYASLKGVQAVIPKPLEYKSFVRKVKTALDNRQHQI
jgi:CheY-like chemotaxis protein